MPGPRPKPPEQLRRRNAPESWTILPKEGCEGPPPPWPLEGKPSKAEADLWKRLWALPVACWWREQAIEPFVVARYVRLVIENPGLTVLARLEADLALTPAAMARLRLVVEAPEASKPTKASRYAHVTLDEP